MTTDTTTERVSSMPVEARPYKLIDPFLNLPQDPATVRKMDPNMARWFKGSKHMIEGATFEDMIAEMDKAGIEKGMLLTAGKSANAHPGNAWTTGQDITDEAFDEALQTLYDWSQRSNGRLKPQIWLDPTEGMKAVRRLERAVKDFGCIACHFMPARVKLPANHPSYYPLYAKAVELGIPVRLNIGVPGSSALRGQPQMALPLDEVCVAFPELTVVSTHVGHPWHLETVAMLQKHANFRLITSGFAPKHVPAEIWRAANTRAAHKVMWSSDFPVLPMDRTANEAWDVPLKDDVKRRYLRDNALETFKLD